jgi:predicted lipoprotein with Yx(FWY)xxD motif
MRTITKFLLPIVASLAVAACGSSSSGSASGSSSQAAAPASSGSQTTASAGGEGAIVKTASSPTLHATVLTDSQGMTLYHLTGESAGKFICTSTACVQIWHPVTVTAARRPDGTVSGLGTVRRPEGTTQVTYRGEPLYSVAQDKQPGEAKGEGIKDVGTWTAVTTGGQAASRSTAPPAPASSSSGSSGSGGSESAGSGGYGY